MRPVLHLSGNDYPQKIGLQAPPSSIVDNSAAKRFDLIDLHSKKPINSREIQYKLLNLQNTLESQTPEVILEALLNIMQKNSTNIDQFNLSTIFQILQRANIGYFLERNKADLDLIFNATAKILSSKRFQNDTEKNHGCYLSLIKAFSAITFGTQLDKSPKAFINRTIDSLLSSEQSQFSESNIIRLCDCLAKISDRPEYALPLLNFFTSTLNKQSSSIINNLTNNKIFIDNLIELVSRYGIKMSDSLFEIIFVYLENNIENLDPKLLAKALFHFNSNNINITNISEFLLEQVSKEKLQEFNDLDLRMATAALRRTLLRHINEPAILKKYLPQLINFSQEFSSRNFSELQHFAALNIYKELGILQHYLPQEFGRYLAGPFKSLEQAAIKQLSLHQNEQHCSEQLVKRVIENHKNEIFGNHQIKIQTNHCDTQTGMECDLLIKVDGGKRVIDLEVDGPRHNNRESIPEPLRDQYLKDKRHIDVIRIATNFYEEAKITAQNIGKIIVRRLKPQFEALLAA